MVVAKEQPEGVLPTCTVQAPDRGVVGPVTVAPSRRRRRKKKNLAGAASALPRPLRDPLDVDERRMRQKRRLELQGFDPRTSRRF